MLFIHVCLSNHFHPRLPERRQAALGEEIISGDRRGEKEKKFQKPFAYCVPRHV